MTAAAILGAILVALAVAAAAGVEVAYWLLVGYLGLCLACAAALGTYTAIAAIVIARSDR